MRHLTSVLDLSRADIESVLATARAIGGGDVPAARGVAGVLFFESSTRTRAGFEAAAARLGVGTFVLNETRDADRMSNPESLEDTIRVVSAYADVLCVRHPDVDAFDHALREARCAVVNCGNGSDEHPTQALADLFAIEAARGRIDGLTVAVVGDLVSMRSAHSLLLALSLFDDVTARLVSPPALQMPDRYVAPAIAAGHCIESTDTLVVDDVDIVYVAGFPPHSPRGSFTAKQRRAFAIDDALARKLPPHARILCPLPRIDEIDRSVDALPVAGYFAQSDAALLVRMAVLERALGSAAA
ncbi:MAG TPA: hypothetical protein VF519_01445 [Mycobacteriales bacterium]|jgi:aspartate carbamoyltransferase catalytic subunit